MYRARLNHFFLSGKAVWQTDGKMDRQVNYRALAFCKALANKSWTPKDTSLIGKLCLFSTLKNVVEDMVMMKNGQLNLQTGGFQKNWTRWLLQCCHLHPPYLGNTPHPLVSPPPGPLSWTYKLENSWRTGPYLGNPPPPSIPPGPHSWTYKLENSWRTGPRSLHDVVTSIYHPLVTL